MNFRNINFATPNDATEAKRMHIAKLRRATIISALIEAIAPAIKQIKINGDNTSNSSKTLTDNVLTNISKKIVSTVEEKTGAKLRS